MAVGQLGAVGRLRLTPSKAKTAGIALGPRTPPSGLGLAVPFTVSFDGSSFRYDYDIMAARPVYTNTIYVGPGGVDTASGLTYALRLRSLKQAITKANALGGTVRIVADPGVYKYSDVVSSIQASWAGVTPSVDLVIESAVAGQKVISLCDVVMPAFVATATDPTVFVSTYTTQTPASAVLDLGNLDSEGQPKLLRRAFPATTDEATVVAALNARAILYGSGAHYLDATAKKLYVKLIGGRTPDANLIVCSTGGTANFWLNQTSATRRIWARDLEFWGSNGGFRVTSGATLGHTIHLLDCTTAYTGAGHGFGFSGGPSVIVSQGCRAKQTGQDGWNYNGGTGLAQAPTFYELDCSSDGSGQATDIGVDGSNNGSSCHVFSRGVRINGVHTNGNNRIIHDIQDSQTWNLGVTSGPSRSPAGSGEMRAAFACGLTGFAGTAKMWLDHCISVGQDRDLEAYAGGTIYAANCTLGAGVNASPDGAVTTYSP